MHVCLVFINCISYSTYVQMFSVVYITVLDTLGGVVKTDRRSTFH